MNRNAFSLVVFLLMTFASSAQSTITEKTIDLHLSDRNNIVRFETNGYILSVDRDRLLTAFDRYEQREVCTAILSSNDVLDLNDIKTRIDLLLQQNSPFFSVFHHAIAELLKEGEAAVQSTITGKEPATIRLIESTRHHGEGSYRAEFHEMDSEDWFFVFYTVPSIAPSF